MNKFAFNITDNCITIMKGVSLPRIVRDSNPNYFRIRKSILAGDYELAYQLASIKEVIVEAVEGSDFSVKDGVVYFGDFILNGVISSKLVKVILEGGKNLTPIKKYVERILKNPSRQSAQELYDFLGYRELPITEDGMVLAWKGVGNDDYSIQGNPSTKVLQGTVDRSGRILNRVGDTIEVARICVDDDRRKHCSHGLHVGSLDYARGWGSKLKLVMFDPADAVSVPTDCNFQKLRVCKYKVIADVSKDFDIEDSIVNVEEIKPAKKKEKTAPTVSVEDALERIVEDMGYDLDYIGDRQDVTELLKVGGYNEEEINNAIDDSTASSLWVKIENYLGHDTHNKIRTVKDIQSALKIKGLTCQQILDIVKKLGYDTYGDEAYPSLVEV